MSAGRAKEQEKNKGDKMKTYLMIVDPSKLYGDPSPMIFPCKDCGALADKLEEVKHCETCKGGKE